MSSALVARADQVRILAPRFLLDGPLQAFGAPACSLRVSDTRPAHHAPADPWFGPDGVGVVVLVVHGATVEGVIRGWWVSLKPPVCMHVLGADLRCRNEQEATHQSWCSRHDWWRDCDPARHHKSALAEGPHSLRRLGPRRRGDLLLAEPSSRRSLTGRTNTERLIWRFVRTSSIAPGTKSSTNFTHHSLLEARRGRAWYSRGGWSRHRQQTASGF